MLHQLEKKKYNKILPVIKDLYHRPALMSVVEGNSPGQIFVDDLKQPNNILVWIPWGFNFLIEDESNDKFNQTMHELIIDKLIPEGIKLGQETGFILYPYPESYCARIETLFTDKLPLKDYRNTFTFHPEKFKKHTNRERNLPTDIHIKRINKKLANRLIDAITWSWISVNDFLARGFGFCLLKDNVIISTCYSIFVGHGIYEIEIDTHPEYRKQGYGKLTASAFISHCLSNGYTPCWECWKGHSESNHLAEELGFKLKQKYPAYSIEFTEFDTYIDHGYYYFRDKKEYEKSARYFKKAFNIKETSAENYYTAACACARAGQKNAAIKFLNIAVNKGWRHIEYLRRSNNFKGLHSSNGWQEILEKLKTKIDKSEQ